jgi:hypothetical protein|tara:strand:- start:38 stop:439 length:402 start_codon:yes stop_codon:yes gene_type:complete
MIPDFIKVARLLGLFLFLSSFGTSAHHSVALQFDMTADITIVGEIVEMEWRNPHSWLHVEVETEQGQVELWRVEFGSGNALYRRGWRRDDLPVGLGVTIHGIPSRDGSRQMEGDEVLLSDGRTLFSGAGPSRE